MINLSLILTLYFIGKGNFVGISGVFLEKIDSIARKYEGNKFDSLNAKRLADEILLFLENKGYPFAQVKFISFSKRKDTLDYSIEIIKGKIGFIHGIEIEGVKRIKPDEIIKILKFKPQIFSKKLISIFKNKLYFFPYLTYLNYYFFENEGRIFLNIVLKEKLSNSMEGGIGYSNESRDFFGDIRLHIDALFGTLRSIDIFWRRIKKGEQDFFISYEEPFFYLLDMKIKGNYSLTQRDTFYTGESFSTLLYFLIYPFKLGIGGSYEENRDFIMEKKEYRVLNITEIEGGKRGYMNNGFYLFLHSKYSGKEYLKIYGVWEMRKIFNFFGILERTFYMNIVKKDKILNPEYFHIGGNENLRGYNEEEFRVKEGYVLNFENYFVLSQVFSPLLFFDTGILDKKRIKFSYGFGVMGERENFSYKILIAFPYKESFYNAKLHVSFIQYF